MTEHENLDRRVQNERRYQSVMVTFAVALCVGGIVGGINKIGDLSIAQARSTEQIASMHDEWQRDVTAMASRYDSNGHRIDVLDIRQNGFDLRLDRVEHAVKKDR